MATCTLRPGSMQGQCSTTSRSSCWMALALTAAASMPSTTSCPAAEHILFRCVRPACCNTHSFIHSNSHAFILPLTRSSSIHSFIHSLTHSLFDLLFHSLIPSFIPSFIPSSVHSFIHPFVHSFMYPFLHPFTHSVIHSIIHSVMQQTSSPRVRYTQF